jgi:hypothetical protein
VQSEGEIRRSERPFGLVGQLELIEVSGAQEPGGNEHHCG